MGDELKQPAPMATSEEKKETILEMLVKLNASLDRILGSSPTSPTSTTVPTTGSMASPNHDIGDKHSTTASPLSGASKMACITQFSQAKEAQLVACHVFNEMPGHQEANTGRGLRVTVSQVFYPVTEEVLHQVFDAYGAEKVCDLEVADRTEALVLFRSSHDALRARDACHGHCIYDNCCWLDLQYVQLLPTNSTLGMPGKCSTPRLSHDAEKQKATSTPVAVSTMPLTISTTSFAQTKAEQPGACRVFDEMPRKTESGARYHRFVKWVSRVRITHRPVRWAMRSKHGNSGCEVEVSNVKEDNAAQRDVLDTKLKHTVKLGIKQPGACKVFEEVVPWSRSSFSLGNVGMVDVCLVFMNLAAWRLGGFNLGAKLLGPRISYCLQVIRMDLLLFSMSSIPWDPGVFRFACLMGDQVCDLIPKASEEQPGYPYELQKPFSVVIIDPEQWKWISCKAVLVLLAKALIDPKECYLLNSDSDVAFDMFNEMPAKTEGFSIFITSKGTVGLQQPSLYLMQQLRAPTLSTTLRYDMVENLKDAVGQAGGSCVVVKSNTAELILMSINCLGLMKTPKHVCQRGDVTYQLLHCIAFLCTVGGSPPYIQNIITDVGLPQELYKEGLNASVQGVLTGGTIDYLFDYHEWGPLEFTDAPRQFHGDINIFTENIMFGTDDRMPMSLLTINSVAHLWLKRMQWSASADCLCFKARKLKRTDIIVRQWDPGIKQIGFHILLLKWVLLRCYGCYYLAIFLSISIHP